MEGTTISRPIDPTFRHTLVLLVSAVDSSGAAGMAQDVRTADRLGHPVRCAVTGVTVQGEKGVGAAVTTPAAILDGCIRVALSAAPPPSAVKVGALIGRTAARAAADALLPIARGGVPIVLDPVLRASRGGRLIDESGLDALLEGLLPISRVVTPNRRELGALAARVGEGSPSEARRVDALMAAGAEAVLVTGGATRGATCVDRLYLPGRPPAVFSHGRVTGLEPRGTGCCLSTAIACHLARGIDLVSACERSVSFTLARIRRSAVVGRQRLLFP